ncbi:hypothetical protein RSAG8_02488, partial [Rhizoctonia solani AG-8 WAC10335]
MFGTDGDFCHLVSQRADAIVLDCDYAKSPEYPFPAAPNDVRDIIAHVTANKERCEGYIEGAAEGGACMGQNSQRGDTRRNCKT